MEIFERRHTKEHLCFYFVQYSSSQNGLQLHISAEALHTWSDSTPLVSCRSISRLQSMLVAVKQSPRSTMSTFKTCNIFGSLLQALLCTHSDWCKTKLGKLNLSKVCLLFLMTKSLRFGRCEILGVIFPELWNP